jgi:hypothetical protein
LLYRSFRTARNARLYSTPLGVAHMSLPMGYARTSLNDYLVECNARSARYLSSISCRPQAGWRVVVLRDRRRHLAGQCQASEGWIG